MGKQIPMLFSAPMILALLEGRKTQTRRIMKPQPELRDGAWYWRSPRYDNGGGADYFWTRCTDGIMGAWTRAMPVQPGDLIWVKETHWAYGYWPIIPGEKTKTGREKWEFNSDEDIPVRFAPPEHPETVRKGMTDMIGWYKRSSLFMSKADSRLTLRVTDVRVQGLQEISEQDATAEGVLDWSLPPAVCNNRDRFADLWNSINGPDAWGANPWVYATTFEVIHQNVMEASQ